MLDTGDRARADADALLAEAGGIALWEWNLRTGTSWWSPMMYRLLGLPEGDGQESADRFLSIVHPFDRDPLNDELTSAIVEKRKFDKEFRILLPDGGERWLAGRGGVIVDDAGEAICMRGVNFDITPEKTARTALSRRNDALEAQSVDDAHALSMAQRAQRDAEERLQHMEQVETLGQLFSGVAHDFNNMLVPIMGTLDMLKRTPQSNPDLDTMIDGASRAAMNARTMVRSMLNFAHRRASKVEMIDFAERLSGMRDLLNQLVPENVRIEFAIGENLPKVEVDGGKFELSIVNLVANARDAMPDGGTIRITGVQVGDTVTIGIADTGMGMDAATLERATQAFFTTKGDDKGTGLGLYMTAGMMERADGVLNIDSAPGRGTTIELSFPAAPEDDQSRG